MAEEATASKPSKQLGLYLDEVSVEGNRKGTYLISAAAEGGEAWSPGKVEIAALGEASFPIELLAAGRGFIVAHLLVVSSTRKEAAVHSRFDSAVARDGAAQLFGSAGVAAVALRDTVELVANRLRSDGDAVLLDRSITVDGEAFAAQEFEVHGDRDCSISLRLVEVAAPAVEAATEAPEVPRPAKRRAAGGEKPTSEAPAVEAATETHG